MKKWADLEFAGRAAMMLFTHYPETTKLYFIPEIEKKSKKS